MNHEDQDMLYEYNEEFQTLQQFDSCGRLIASMQMLKQDLEKISFLAWVLSQESTKSVV